MTLCKYKDALGIPNQGVHSYRIANIALADVGLLLAVSYLISWLCSIRFPLALLISFVIGIVLHRIFCVRTTIDRLLFG